MMSLSPYTRQPTCYEIEALIHEVQRRPSIWNKNSDGYTDRRLKTRMWEEVCESLIDNWKKLKAIQKHRISCDIQKKWRNVKDSFNKELHMERRISAGEAERKKRRYVHYKALSFLASGELETSSNTAIEESDEDSDCTNAYKENVRRSNRKRVQKENSDEQEKIVRIKCERVNSDEEPSNNEEAKVDEDHNSLLEIEMRRSSFTEEPDSNQKKIQIKPKIYPEAHFVEMPCNTWEDDESLNSKKHQDYVRNIKVYDEDVTFKDMIIPMLAKLNEDQKHFAKVEIMNILHKAKRYHSSLAAESQTDKARSGQLA